MPKFQKFAELRHQDKYYVRGTFTHYNTDFAADVLHLADIGFKQISVEPVVAPPTEDYAIREEDLPVIFEQYDILAREMIKREKEGRGFNFFHFMIDLTGGPCVYKRLSGCGSGTEYLAVTPWGDFYPCHQFVGQEDFCLGNVYEGVKKTETVNEFKKCNVYSKKECSQCFARFYCSGGCAANSYNFTGKINDCLLYTSIPSLFDGIGMGLGFTVGLTLIGMFRELIGAGTLFGIQVMPSAYEPVNIFIMAPGAFLVLAMLVAVQNRIKRQKSEKTGKPAVPAEETGCMACANKAYCQAVKGKEEAK